MGSYVSNYRRMTVERVAEMAARAFAEHEIECTLDRGLHRSWKCCAKLRSMYWFVVTTIPGSLIVTGDVGELIVQRVPDMLPWCKNARNDIDYFAQKVPHCIKTREYDPDVAKRWLDDCFSDETIEIDYEDRLELYEQADYGADCFYRAIAESGINDGCDPPDATNWNGNFLWCREAVNWLVERLPQ